MGEVVECADGGSRSGTLPEKASTILGVGGRQELTLG